MGYNTKFEGQFNLDRELDNETFVLLNGLANTRRVMRNIEGYGVDGEFYIDGGGYKGQEKDSTIIDFNCPPAPQPGLWLQWIPTEDRKAIVWDGQEKFYAAPHWILYLIERILKPRGYILNGTVNVEDQGFEEKYSISIVNNSMEVDFL